MVKLTILHTNDVHSRIDPFPMDGTRNAGQGGAARRARLIASIRKQEEHVLLLDAVEHAGEDDVHPVVTLGLARRFVTLLGQTAQQRRDLRDVGEDDRHRNKVIARNR